MTRFPEVTGGTTSSACSDASLSLMFSAEDPRFPIESEEMFQIVDYYALLGVGREASETEKLSASFATIVRLIPSMQTGPFTTM